MIILCDLDGIVADLLSEWLRRHNADHPDHALAIGGVIDFDLHKIAKCGDHIHSYIRQPGLFSAIKPLPGAVEGVKRLNDVSDLLIVTSPSKHPATCSEKAEWVERYLPFLNHRQIMLCSRKELVHGDWLIDDSPSNLGKWRAGKTATITYPYNAQCYVDFRPFGVDYRDTTLSWLAICQRLRA